ncbi:DUF3592 domain-containing protein [Patescibacteria group bacterium]|nr:DUF3592 domain-containing protein [Patescibacteria group bacterium]
MIDISSWIPLLFAIGALREAFLTIRLMHNGERAQGIVSRLAADYDEGTPIIQYKTKKGEQREFRLSTRYRGDSFEIGQPVPILYDPEHLKRVVVDKTAHRWAGTALWIFFGCLFFVGRYIVLISQTP